MEEGSKPRGCKDEEVVGKNVRRIGEWRSEVEERKWGWGDFQGLRLR